MFVIRERIYAPPVLFYVPAGY